MDYEKGRKDAREDVIAVLDGTDGQRREQLAWIAVWAVGKGKRIAKAEGQSAPGARSVAARDVDLGEAERQRASVLADVLRQTRAAA